MEHAKAPYSAVYHFRDDHLLEAFIGKIPHSQLVEYLRNDEPLRNRYFRGFRNTALTRQQILSAYKHEILDRNNGVLASALCADWVRQQPALASVALKSLGIQSEDPANANEWINDVHAKIELEQNEDCFRVLVRALAMKFIGEDIHIFVSIISYGRNQDTLRKLVDEELLNAANDPQLVKEWIEDSLEAAKTKINDLKQLVSTLESQRESELGKSREALEGMVREDNVFAASLTQEDASIQELANQLEDTKARLHERQQARDATKKQKEKLSKTISRQREELLKTQTSYEKRLKEVCQSLDKESSHMAELCTRLQEIEDRSAADRSKQALVKPEPLGAQPQPPAQNPAPGPTPPPAAAQQEPQKRPSDILGNNAICYQGIQRTFRNAVVLFLRDRLACLFPDDHIQRLKKTFGEEWEKAEQNAAQSRACLGTETTVRDEYDLLGTNHFYNIFERFFDKIFTPEVGQPPNQ